MTILNTPNAQSAEAKAKADFANKKFCIGSTSLKKYLSCNSDVAAYCQEVFETIPQYETVGKVLSAIVEEDKRLPKCIICGEYISNKLVRNRRSKGKPAYFCSTKCSMSDEGKKIQVDLYKEATGGINPMSTEEGKQRQRQAIFDKFGVYNVSELPEIRAKANQTTFERYGVYNIWSNPDTIEKMQLDKRIKKYNILISSLRERDIDVLFSLDEYLAFDKNEQLVKFKCNKCGCVFESSIKPITGIHCQNCGKLGQ